MSDYEMVLRYEVIGKRQKDVERIKASVPLELDTGDFRLTSEGLDLRAFTENYDDVEMARAALEPTLDALRKDALLDDLRIEFRFSASELLVKSEPNVRKAVVVCPATAKAVVSASVVSVSPPQQAWPQSLTLTKDSEKGNRMVQKVHDLKDGTDRSLCAHAYSILTEIENSCRGRKGARERYKICMTVLTKLGELTSQNDPVYGRKAKGDVKKFTREELDWVRKAAEMVGYRVIEVEFGRSLNELSLITLDSLPKLTK